MKNILSILMLSLCATFVACSDSDGGDGNPDGGNSVYVPLPGRKVASVKTTSKINGRDYSWEHKFTYDAQGRIKEINSNIQDHINRNGRHYLCNKISTAYYYYNGENLEVDYDINWIFPEDMTMNTRTGNKDFGIFNSDGFLKVFKSVEIGVSSDFEYSGKYLTKAYSDGGFVYELNRSNGDVLGYRLKVDDKLKDDRYSRYGYSANFRNKINMDMSAYFGYWGVEERIYANASPLYASYQLAAFGMLGATSTHLPISVYNEETKMHDDGTWEFDSKDCPISYTDPSGRKTTITYVD